MLCFKDPGNKTHAQKETHVSGTLSVTELVSETEAPEGSKEEIQSRNWMKEMNICFDVLVQKWSRKKETRNRPVNQKVKGAIRKNCPPVAFILASNTTRGSC